MERLLLIDSPIGTEYAGKATFLSQTRFLYSERLGAVSNWQPHEAIDWKQTIDRPAELVVEAFDEESVGRVSSWLHHSNIISYVQSYERATINAHKLSKAGEYLTPYYISAMKDIWERAYSEVTVENETDCTTNCTMTE